MAKMKSKPVSVRLSTKQYIKVLQSADENDINVSEYMVSKLFDDSKEKLVQLGSAHEELKKMVSKLEAENKKLKAKKPSPPKTKEVIVKDDKKEKALLASNQKLKKESIKLKSDNTQLKNKVKGLDFVLSETKSKLAALEKSNSSNSKNSAKELNNKTKEINEVIRKYKAEKLRADKYKKMIVEANKFLEDRPIGVLGVGGKIYQIDLK